MSAAPSGKDTEHARPQQAFRSCRTPLPRGVGGRAAVGSLTFYVSLVNLDFVCNKIWERKLRSGPFLLLMCNLNAAKKRCHTLIFRGHRRRGRLHPSPLCLSWHVTDPRLGGALLALPRYLNDVGMFQKPGALRAAPRGAGIPSAGFAPDGPSPLQGSGDGGADSSLEPTRMTSVLHSTSASRTEAPPWGATQQTGRAQAEAENGPLACAREPLATSTDAAHRLAQHPPAPSEGRSSWQETGVEGQPWEGARGDPCPVPPPEAPASLKSGGGLPTKERAVAGPRGRAVSGHSPVSICV